MLVDHFFPFGIFTVEPSEELHNEIIFFSIVWNFYFSVKRYWDEDQTRSVGAELLWLFESNELIESNTH